MNHQSLCFYYLEFMTASFTYIYICFNQSVIRIKELTRCLKIKPEIQDNKKQISSKNKYDINNNITERTINDETKW
jgi:hypothetical protein